MPEARSDGPRVVLGAPLYEHAEHLPAALRSLQAQTHRDFALVMVDDASADATARIAANYAGHDPRLTLERNDRRLGLIANWRRAFEAATTQFPAAELFAWVSDHDVWEPRWLERLLAVLDTHPDAVLAYPDSTRIRADGVHKRGGRPFTAGERSPRTRLRRTGENATAGAMVYGLMRVDALREAGVLRDVLQPDRLLIAELALQGQLLRVPGVLWHRRVIEGASLERQRRTLFGDAGAPRSVGLPPLAVHCAHLARRHGPRSAAAYARGRATRAARKRRGARAKA